MHVPRQLDAAAAETAALQTLDEFSNAFVSVPTQSYSPANHSPDSPLPDAADFLV